LKQRDEGGVGEEERGKFNPPPWPLDMNNFSQLGLVLNEKF